MKKTLFQTAVMAALLVPLVALAQYTANTGERPGSTLETLLTVNGAPEAGQVLTVSTTSATETGFLKGKHYVIACTTAAYFLPGSVTVTAATDGSAGAYVPANVPVWFFMPTDKDAVSVLGTGSGTCTFNRWK